MHSAAIELFQMLVHAGAKPGEDFSCDGESQAYRLSARCYELLQQTYPDIAWDELLTTAPYDPQPIVETLHETLGVPFVDRLLDRIHISLPELPDAQAVWYLRQLLNGVERRTGLLLYPLLESKLDLAAQARLEWLIRMEEGEPCDRWLVDLILAAGGSPQDVELLEDGGWLTERGMTLLDTVWGGDYELTAPSYGPGLSFP